MVLLFIVVIAILMVAVIVNMIKCRPVYGQSEPNAFELFYKKYSDRRFNKSEIQIIYNAMDKTDYSAIVQQRYMDYDRIKNEIIKIRNQNQHLSGMRISHVLESYPPQTFYKYSFT